MILISIEKKLNGRREIKLSAAKYEAAKAKDRARKRNKTIFTADSSTTLEISFTSQHSFGQATAKVICSLCKTTREDKRSYWSAVKDSFSKK